MVLNNRTGRRPLKAIFACALSLLIVLATFSFAFGDFVPVTTTKVLGVGRIQSTLPAVPVVAAEKFALATAEAVPEQTAELVEPISREVAIVEVTPEPEPEPPVETQAPQNTAPVESDGEWITSIATNYATPGDGFLGKKTASGALTTTTSMGVAHKNLPLGAQIELYNPRTGLSCVATVNDRGPYDGRPDSFDFQMGVTSALGNSTGWYTVQYRVVS